MICNFAVQANIFIPNFVEIFSISKDFLSNVVSLLNFGNLSMYKISKKNDSKMC